MCSKQSVAPLTCFMATESNVDTRDEKCFHSQWNGGKRASGLDHRSVAGQHLSSQPVAASASPTSSPCAMSKMLSQDHILPTSSTYIAPAAPESAFSVLSSDVSSLTSSTGHDSLTVSSLWPTHEIAGQSSSLGSHASVLVPQLIMPSMVVPRRRPFTNTGKSLGKLKILVAGQAGTSMPAYFSQRKFVQYNC